MAVLPVELITPVSSFEYIPITIVFDMLFLLFISRLSRAISSS